MNRLKFYWIKIKGESDVLDPLLAGIIETNPIQVLDLYFFMASVSGIKMTESALTQLFTACSKRQFYDIYLLFRPFFDAKSPQQDITALNAALTDFLSKQEWVNAFYMQLDQTEDAKETAISVYSKTTNFLKDNLAQFSELEKFDVIFASK